MVTAGVRSWRVGAWCGFWASASALVAYALVGESALVIIAAELLAALVAYHVWWRKAGRR